MLVARKGKELKSLNKVGEYVDVICMNKVDTKEYDNITVNTDVDVLNIIKPSEECKEIYDKIEEYEGMKKKKREEKTETALAKFEKAFKKQLKKSLDVEILLYTVAKKFTDGAIVFISAKGLSDYEEEYLKVFAKYVEKKTGMDLGILGELKDFKDSYDGKKKKLPKKLEKELVELAGDRLKDFVKQSYKNNSIYLCVTELLKSKDVIFNDKDGSVTIAGEDKIEVKAKVVRAALEYAYKNDSDAKKFFKDFIKEGRAVAENGKKIKSFEKFLDKADKISLIRCLVDVYMEKLED